MRGSDLINTRLPDELLFDIFQRFDGSKAECDAISLVCKKWMRIERSCRRTIRIAASSSSLDLVTPALVSRFTALRCLFIDERVPVHSPIVPRLTPRKRRTGSSSQHHLVTENSETESELEHFCLSDIGLSSLANGCKGLEKLSLIWCSSITSSGLKSIAENCRFLKFLDMQGSYIGDQGLTAVGQCCKQLEDLNLRFCEELTDPGLIEFAQHCGRSLKSLGIAACTWITDRSLIAVASHCTCLETLSLDSEFFRNEGIISVARSCRSLKVLKLQCINVTDEALQIVGSLCSALELLALYSFQRFTDRALLELALLYCQRIGNSALFEVGRNCLLLQVLQLVDCLSINDEAICMIARGCRNLRKLHIRRCYEVGDKGLIEVGENCQFLTDLSLRFVDRVGDDALVSIGRGCSLRHLNVSGCPLVTDVGLTAIARGCPELTYLDISVLQGIGDMSLAELGERCPFLKDIVLSHCKQITDIGLSHLVKGCARLETCHMVYCPSITSAGVATVVSSCSSIKKILIEKWKENWTSFANLKICCRNKQGKDFVLQSLLWSWLVSYQSL